MRLNYRHYDRRVFCTRREILRSAKNSDYNKMRVFIYSISVCCITRTLIVLSDNMEFVFLESFTISRQTTWISYIIYVPRLITNDRILREIFRYPDPQWMCVQFKCGTHQWWLRIYRLTNTLIGMIYDKTGSQTVEIVRNYFFDNKSGGILMQQSVLTSRVFQWFSCG